MQTTNILQVEQTNEQSLLSKIDDLIKARLSNFLSNPISSNVEEDVYLTREQVAKLLQVSEVTIWQWSKPDKGILKPYRIGCKVRFKRSEVLQSPKAFNIGKEVKP
ncbi:helix-turn-helix domain-containing protein [Cellulophaga sp. BC115SP]|uniref:helix-turn-helix domain-containing protein n=1 Tax=Cellulophaga sp. BC115SP TaxID=2683263 RepID=UPI0014128D2C|nr:helix-turn-helix domain-containing protein [Cellulophaga sp. BC115SP]NBB27443.1 helix-turn-helix domain-containing protein [Cellulophaga sp. BC115SP]